MRSVKPVLLVLVLFGTLVFSGCGTPEPSNEPFAGKISGKAEPEEPSGPKYKRIVRETEIEWLTPYLQELVCEEWAWGIESVSPDLRRIAIFCKGDESDYVVIDGKRIDVELTDSWLGVGIAFSSDSAHYSFAGCTLTGDDKRVDCLVFDGTIITTSLDKMHSPIQTDWGGGSFAYVEIDYEFLCPRVSRIVLDGIAVAELCEVRELRFIPDSRQLAYIAEYLLDEGTGIKVVIGNEEFPGFTGEPCNLLFSEDGSAWAVTLKNGEKCAAAINGKVGREYDSVRDVVFSGDGKRFAYFAKNGGDFKVIVDGEEVASYRNGRAGCEGKPVFSSSGDSVAWAVIVGDTAIFAFDGDIVGRYPCENEFFAPIVSAGDDGFAYVGGIANKAQTLYFRGQRIEYSYVPMFVLSPDGENIAYYASDTEVSGIFIGAEVVVEDTLESYVPIPDFLSIGPGGRHLAYANFEFGGGWYSEYVDRIYIVDSEEGPVYKYLVTNVDCFIDTPKIKEPIIIWDSPTKFHYLALDGDKIYLIEEEIVEE